MTARQSFIDSFFKNQKDSDSGMKKVRKRNLSLIKPSSTHKESQKISDFINLCSDDDEEDIWENTPKSRALTAIDLSQCSTDSDFTDSQRTIVYSPNNCQTPTTPKKIKTEETTLKKLPSTLCLKTEPCEDAENIVPMPSSPTFTQKAGVTQAIKTEPLFETPQKATSSRLVRTPQSVSILDSSTKSQQDKSPKTIFDTPQKATCSQVVSSPQSVSILKSPTKSQQDRVSKSPKTREKYFSPTKKRSVVVRKPGPKVKRSLSIEMSRSIPSRILFEDELFDKACEGMDDKTKFLLETINKYLNAPSLKHLLDEESHKLLTNCLQVVKPGMRLVCRLYWRKDGWFKKENTAQICSETKDAIIDDSTFYEMMQSLIENGLIVPGSSSNMSFDDFVALLNRDELKQICRELKLRMSSKQDAVEALKNFSKRASNISHFLTGYTSNNADRVLKIMSIKAGPCYKLSELARNTIYKLHIIMYLGIDYTIIREKRLELALLYDKIKRETYPIDKDMELDDASIVFRTRDEFARYLTAHNIYEDYLIRIEVSEKCSIVKQVYNLYKAISEEEYASYTSIPKWLHRFTPAHIYVKILDTGIQELKKEKSYSLASEILVTLLTQDGFRQHRKADWYAEQALILHTYLGEHDEAAKLLLEGFNSDLSEEAKDRMRERAKKIANQKNAPISAYLKLDLLEFCNKECLLEANIDCKHVHKQPMDRVGKRGKVRFETRTPTGRLVEEAEEFAIGHYLYTEGFTHGEHWEGKIINSLFFLLFWDIIYSRPPDVRGVFLCRFQQYPLDLFTDSFYANRRQIIEDWLFAIHHSNEDKLLQTMEETWKSRPECELSGVSRRGITWDQLGSVARCLGPARLAALCRRLATRYRYAHSGFPDLTLWDVNTKRIKFVEVKTDSDKPSTKQKQWLHYLRSHGIDAEFCYVGAQTTRQRARKKPTHSEVKVEQ